MNTHIFQFHYTKSKIQRLRFQLPITMFGIFLCITLIIFLILVCVYLNHDCHCGPYLSSELVKKLPTSFGPGSLNRTLKDTIQACVDSALQSSVKSVYQMAKEGELMSIQ